MFNLVSYRNYGPKGESVQILGAEVGIIFGIEVDFIVDIQRPSGTNHCKKGVDENELSWESKIFFTDCSFMVFASCKVNR